MKYLNKDFLKNIVDWMVDNAEHVLIRATPILSPLPSAFAIVHALTNAGWAQPMLMGGVIEAMGMGAGATIGFITSHNRQNPDRTIDPRFGYGLFAFYVLVAASIIGGYETLPVLFSESPSAADAIRSIVPLLFPGLTLIGSVIVALQAYMRRTEAETAHQLARSEANEDTQRQHDEAQFNLDMEIRRLEAEQRLALERAQAEQKMEIERQRADAKLSTKLSTPVKSVDKNESPTTSVKPVDGVNVDTIILDFYRDNPHGSLRKAGAAAGISHTAVSNKLEDFEARGIVHRNGNGVEVLI